MEFSGLWNWIFIKLIFGIEFLGTSNMNMDFHSSIPIIIITMELSKKKKPRI